MKHDRMPTTLIKCVISLVFIHTFLDNVHAQLYKIYNNILVLFRIFSCGKKAMIQW